MAEREPVHRRSGDWMEAQLREVAARVELDRPPGRTAPVRLDLDPDDDLWWVRAWLKREDLQVPLPEALAVRRAVQDLYASFSEVPTEGKLRALVEALNHRILEVNRTNVVGPPTTQGLLDVPTVVTRWRRARSAAAGGHAPDARSG